LTKHATSKIKDIDDLLSLSTMGFRGEALHSIQTVSKLTIISNTDNQSAGYKISNDGENPFTIIPSPAKKGTKIEVSDLFYNIPARRKFLKSGQSEFSTIKKVIFDKAMSFLDVSFYFYNDEKLIFATKGDGSFENAFFSINKTESKFAIFDHSEIINKTLQIKIYYSNVNTFFPNRKYQTLFVNKRPVSVNFFYPAIDNGIKNYISPGRHPLFYVFIDIDSSLIDVNIHPAKKEIKFYNNSEIFTTIQSTVTECMSKIIKRDILEIENTPFKITEIQKEMFTEDQTDYSYFKKTEHENYVIPQKNNIQEDIITNYENNHKIKTIQQPEEQKTVSFQKNYKIIGVAFDNYIIVEKDDKILLIDQHAACEAIIFYKKKQRYAKGFDVEKLLMPAIIQVDNWDNDTEKRLEILNKNNFLIEKDEGNTVFIREMPSILLSNKDYQIACDIVLKFLEEKGEIKADIIDFILIESSCKEAVKQGDKLTLIEIAEIIDDYFKYEIKNCPHGRPAHFELSKDNLEKVFQRKK
ncbi:MAG: hypothetical protein A2Y34_11310, partial [Spirochaetes bacterium GWC1_27_15]